MCFMALAHADSVPLGEVRFEGDLPFSESFARKRVDFPKGVVLDSEMAQAAAERLRISCLNRRYPLAHVSWQAVMMEEESPHLALIFLVEPGLRGRLQALRFEGNRALSADKLSEGLLVRKRSGLWARVTGRDILLPDLLGQDHDALLRHYQHEGYADASIGEPILEWVDALGGFRLTWPILHEGPSYRIGSVRFDGDVLTPIERLGSAVDAQVGDVYDHQQIELDAGNLIAACRQLGHAFAVADAEVTLDADSAQADILFRIHAGKRPKLRDIHVQGLERTNERIVLREISLAPGEVFDATALELAVARLSLLPMFSQAPVLLDGAAEDPYFDIIVDVQERKTGRFELGYAHDSDAGGAFQWQVLDRNLALRPWFRGQALQGTLGLTWGSSIVRIETGLRNPRIGHSFWDVAGQAFFEDQDYLSNYYSQRSHGGHLLFGRPLGKTQRLELGYETEVIALYDFDEEWLDVFEEFDENVRLTSVVALWRMNRTDTMFRPTRGFRLEAGLRAGSRALGGNTDVLRSRLTATGFVSPFWEHVTSLRLEASSVYPYGETEDVPAALRLHWGGSNNLRGFESRSVSPLDDDGVPVGGLSGWLAVFEHLVPIGSRLDLALYVEAGDVGPEAFVFTGDGPVANYGVGLLVRAHNFPVRLDFAIPFEVVANDRQNEKGKGRFSFSAGYRY